MGCREHTAKASPLPVHTMSLDPRTALALLTALATRVAALQLDVQPGESR